MAMTPPGTHEGEQAAGPPAGALPAKTTSKRGRRGLDLWPWAVIVATATVAGLLLGQNLFFQLDGRLYDIGIAAHAHRPQVPTDDIVIVGLTEEFIEQRPVGLMPRDKLADLLNIIATGKPSAVVLDVWLDSRVD